MTAETEQPIDSDHLARLVREAANQERQLRAYEVFRPGNDDTIIDLSALGQVVDYPARDMTITVQAGMTFEKLAVTLAEEGQQLPIDVPDLAMTVGEAVVTDTFGPRHFGYGTMRDYVIGIEAVDGLGRVFHSGGRVVKNVAGYDLCRLLVGSHGLLGIVSQVTFKVKPITEETTVRTWSIATEQLGSALDVLNLTASSPVIIDVLIPASDDLARQPGQSQLRIGFAGLATACEWQADCLSQELRQSHCDAIETPPMTLADHISKWAAHRGNAQLRVLPSKVAAISTSLSELGYSVFAHASGTSIRLNRTSATDQTESDNEPAILRNLCQQHGDSSTVILMSDPARQTAQLSPTSRRLRDTFDPHGVFSR